MSLPDNYTGLSPLYCGMNPPATQPAWLAGRPLNEWFAIAGTSGAGGAVADTFSGFVVRDDTSEIFIPLAGGHGVTDNRTVSIQLSDDAPAWVLRNASSTAFTDGAAYNADGKPASRHTYSTGIWCPQRNRIMVHGAYGLGTMANTSRTVDGFNPDTNTWDAAGTWANIPSPINIYSMCRGKNGDAWLAGGGRWNQATDTYTTLSWPQTPRFPGSYDSLRDQVFTLQYSDGQTLGGGGLIASKISAAGAQTVITFNASAALTALTALQPLYAGMDYDPDTDKHYFYPGRGSRDLYVITPNSGTVWDVSILALGAGSATLPDTPAGGSGINGRFRRVPGLKGFVLLPQQSSNLYFIRTA